MVHEIKLEGFEGTLEELANDIGELRYDSTLKFLDALAKNYEKQSEADAKRGRHQLAQSLHETSLEIRETYNKLYVAWKISKPYMAEELKEKPSLID